MLQHIVFASLLASVVGHGYVLDPPPRAANNISGVPAGSAGSCVSGVCFWFNQGCTIGCPKCLGSSSSVAAKAGCGKDQGKPTLPDYARTVWYNEEVPLIKQKKCGINPWCAPGTSPMFSPCGVAGGDVKPGAPGAGGDSPFGVPQGFDGSAIVQAYPKKTVWTAGGVAEISWAVIANHGGGYQYRLCRKPPAGGKLTEECFQQTPLKFAEDQQYIQWVPAPRLYGPYSYSDTTPTFKTPDATNRTAIPAVDVSVGTVPNGSTWRRNPIPACRSPAEGAFGFKCGSLTPFLPGSGGGGTKDTDYQFKPATEDKMRPGFLLGGFGAGGCYGMPFGRGCGGGPVPGALNRVWEHVFQFNVVDKVQVPKVPAGDYVMSFRWDCEQTPQIWSTCSDITIVEGDILV